MKTKLYTLSKLFIHYLWLNGGKYWRGFFIIEGLGVACVSVDAILCVGSDWVELLLGKSIMLVAGDNELLI